MRERKKKIISAALVVLVLTVAVWWSEKSDAVPVENGQLLRRENGGGGYEVEVLLTIDETEETEWVILVPEQTLTKQEEEAFLAAAIREIEAEFAGENVSLETVRDRVVIRNHYQNGKVAAEWGFSIPGLITDAGFIREEALIEEKEPIEASVDLLCGDSRLVYEFYFVACKHEKGEKELFYEKLYQIISESGKEKGADVLWLPENVEGHSLVWKNKESHLPLQVFFLGMVVVMLLPALETEREKEIWKRREERLLREYPELVNKLALLLGAGMTLQGAWRRITEKYSKKGTAGETMSGCVYEEMLITQREIESGKGEARAYEAFGERCGLPKYRKLGSYLVQNLKKGNRDLCELLEREATEAFAERRNMVQRYGEEAGTKLLFPMLLMLGIVVFIVMVPAVISFQSGVN